MQEHRLGKDNCPWCGHEVDAATNVKAGDGRRPQPGDATICINCGEWSMFADNLFMRKPTEQELFEIGENPGCQYLRKAWVRTFGH